MGDEDETIYGPFLHPRLPGPLRIGQRILDKALDRDLAIAAAQHEYREAQQARAEAAQLREKLDRRQRKDRYDQVIERYNRAHGQNPKITLRQVCDEMGESYTAVRKYRQRAPKHKNKK